MSRSKPTTHQRGLRTAELIKRIMSLVRPTYLPPSESLGAEASEEVHLKPLPHQIHLSILSSLARLRLMVRDLARRVRVPFVLRFHLLNADRAIFFTFCSRSGWGSRLVAAVPRNPRWEAWSLNQFPVPASDLAVTVFCTLPRATAVCTGLSSRGPLSGAVRTGWKKRVVAALLAIIHVRSLAANPYRGTNRAPALLSARVC